MEELINDLPEEVEVVDIQFRPGQKVYYFDPDGVQYAVVPVMVDGAQLVLTTDENGSAISPELTCGVYFLIEVKAPAGYNLLDGAVSVTVVSSEITEVTTVEIANQRGALLPETGGMGAEKFWMVGCMLIMAAAVVLIAKKRADANR